MPSAQTVARSDQMQVECWMGSTPVTQRSSRPSMPSQAVGCCGRLLPPPVLPGRRPPAAAGLCATPRNQTRDASDGSPGRGAGTLCGAGHSRNKISVLRVDSSCYVSVSRRLLRSKASCATSAAPIWRKQHRHMPRQALTTLKGQKSIFVCARLPGCLCSSKHPHQERLATHDRQPAMHAALQQLAISHRDGPTPS